MRASTIFLFAALTGCAVAPPTSSGSGSAGILGGKADGAGWCNQAEIDLLSCIVDRCPDEDEECIEASCADVSVEVSLDCGECIESHFGDLELSAARCLGAVTPPGACAESAELVACVAESCEGMAGDPLLECLGESCEAEAEDASEACGECILVRSALGTEELLSCARDGSPVSCSPEEIEAVATCAAESCAELEGDDYDRCLGETCGPVFLTIAPVCFECMGTNLDAGRSLDETSAICGGDAPADDGARVCSYEEMADVLGCAAESCAGLAGDELNECLDASCTDTLEAAELSEPCATCFIYSIEGGESLESTTAACVSDPA